MNILNNYLARNGYSIVEGNDATRIFIANKKIFENICGENIFDTLDDFMSDEDSEDIKLVIINNETRKPTSVFLGSIDNDTINSDYTCSHKIRNGGVLLRFYALLLEYSKNPKIVKIKGGISGGIPAINPADSSELIKEKTDNLIAYHIRNGAQVEGKQFIYNLEYVNGIIAEKFAIRGGKVKRKTRKLKRKKKRRQTKRNRL